MDDFQCIIWKVKHGSAAFIRTPKTITSSSRTIMLDAGMSDDFSPANHLKSNWGLNNNDKRLSKIIISHPDRDHIQDLPHVYSLLYPKILYRNKSIPESIVYPNGTFNLIDPLKTYYNMSKKYICELSPGDKNLPISNWGGVLVETFHCKPEHAPYCPEDRVKNNLSLLTYVRYKDLEIVFPGDLEPMGWDSLLDYTNIQNYVGKAEVRVLVASHHGRKSGIRYPDESVYARFLNIMLPHIVIISDQWGNETTDPDAYRPHCLGYPVYFRGKDEVKFAEILTTKTNLFVRIQYSYADQSPSISAP